MINGHGSDIFRYKEKIVADFSSNVWYEGMPEGLTDRIASQLEKLVHYPQPDAGDLGKKLAQHHQLTPQNILVTNGASEAFYLLAQYFSGRCSVIPQPAFAEYRDACSIFNHHIIDVKKHNALNEIDPKVNDIIWIGNPNNPDGKLTTIKQIETFCKTHPKATLIVDEAYAELCLGFESCIGLINRFDNLIIIKSLTKAFAIPGIRLGYLLANPELIAQIMKIKMPWSVNTMAIEAGKYILANHSTFLPNKERMIEQSRRLQHQLQQIEEIEVTPTACNYFLLKTLIGNSAALKSYLIEKYGLLIRDASNFIGLSDRHFRVAIQDNNHNDQLIKAIKEWIEAEKKAKHCID